MDDPNGDKNRLPNGSNDNKNNPKDTDDAIEPSDDKSKKKIENPKAVSKDTLGNSSNVDRIIRENPYYYRNECVRLGAEKKQLETELTSLQTMYRSLLSKTSTKIESLQQQIGRLQTAYSDQLKELNETKKVLERRIISPEEVKSSKAFKEMKSDLKNAHSAKLRASIDRAVELAQEKAAKQNKKLQDRHDAVIKKAKLDNSRKVKEIADQKRIVTNLQKTIQGSETQERRLKLQLSRTRMDMIAAMKERKTAEAQVRAVNKTLAVTEKQRIELQKELEKALKAKEIKRAEAAKDALKKEELALAKEKLKCESRLHSKVLVMELDRKKKEHLLRAQASIRDDLAASKEERKKKEIEDRRKKRDEEATDRLVASLRGVRRINRVQNAGEFPLLDSPEAASVNFLQTNRANQGIVESHIPNPHVLNQNGLVAQLQNPQMASVLTNVVNAMASRGHQFQDDDLPEGVRLIRDEGTGRIVYETPPSQDGTREIVANRDDLFRKRSAPTLLAASPEGEMNRRVVRPRYNGPEIYRQTEEEVLQQNLGTNAASIVANLFLELDTNGMRPFQSSVNTNSLASNESGTSDSVAEGTQGSVQVSPAVEVAVVTPPQEGNPSPKSNEDDDIGTI